MGLPQNNLDRRHHVEPPDMDARIAEGWSRLQEARRPSRSRWGAAAAAVALLAAGLSFLWSREPTLPRMSETLETHQAAAQVAMADGSTVRAEPETTVRRGLESEGEVRLELVTGAARFDVEPNADRAFVVEAGTVEVRVVGTGFWVSRANARVDVRVEHGAVDVRQGSTTTRLRAGESLSLDEPPVEVAPAEPEPAEEPEEPVQSETPEPAQRETEPVRRADAGPSAAELFTRAQAARAAGEHRDAVRHFLQVAQRHPRDLRAGIAAMEAGRLQMDSLRRPRDAVRSFRLAIRRAPASPLREDAMARIVRAYETLGDEARCVRAQNAYLDRYSNGRHANDIRRRCAE
ncbi:MAG: FecR family protein [Myxococcota bacterium]